MIKVDISNDYGDEPLELPYTFFSDIFLASFFDFIYENDEVHSFVKENDKKNEKEHKVSVLITNDDTIRILNSKYRNIDSPTDVLSFAQNDENNLGDIVISYPTLLRNTEEFDVCIIDEYFRLLAHGFLHLLGYDHKTNDFKKEKMLLLQEKLLFTFLEM